MRPECRVVVDHAGPTTFTDREGSAPRWQDGCDEIRRGVFFEKIERAANPQEAARRLGRLPLIRTERLWEWAREPGGQVEQARRHGDVRLDPVFHELLRRSLIGLEARRDPALLLEFWPWAAELSGAGPFARLWEGRVEDLRRTCLPAQQVSIAAQEARLVRLLSEAAAALRGEPRLAWAWALLRREADRLAPWTAAAEAPSPRPLKAARVRVVFAWDDPATLPPDLRPGLLVDMELRRQGDGDWIGHPRVFDRSFLEPLERVRHRIGTEYFYALHPDLELEGEGMLVGGSAALAVWLAQRLALGLPSASLLPWVVVTATVDWDRPDARSAAVAGRVGLLREKLTILAEEGVRAALVVEPEPPPAPPGLTLLPISADDVDGLAERVRRDGLTAPVDLSHLANPELALRERERVRRRQFLVRTTVAASGLAVASSAGLGWWLNRGPQTLAMRRHRPDRLRVLAGRYLQRPDRFRDEFGDLRPGSGPPGLWVDSPPRAAFLEDFEVLEDSKLFDSVDWRPVVPGWRPGRPARPGEDRLIGLEPIETAYFTRVMRLRKRPDRRVDWVAIEFNTGGFGVAPLIEGGSRFVRCPKSMYQSQAPKKITFTGFLLIDVSALGNDGEEFEVRGQAVYFNGSQDQVARRFKDESGNDTGPCTFDWWGSRVHPRTAAADLAVHLPHNYKYTDVKKMMRVEVNPQEWKRLPQDGQEGLIAGDWEIPDWYPWPITCPPKSDKPTIFSIEWTWAADTGPTPSSGATA
jgi:hypothetical protein